MSHIGCSSIGLTDFDISRWPELYIYSSHIFTLIAIYKDNRILFEKILKFEKDRKYVGIDTKKTIRYCIYEGEYELIDYLIQYDSFVFDYSDCEKELYDSITNFIRYKYYPSYYKTPETYEKELKTKIIFMLNKGVTLSALSELEHLSCCLSSTRVTFILSEITYDLKYELDLIKFSSLIYAIKDEMSDHNKYYQPDDFIPDLLLRIKSLLRKT